MNHGKSRLQRFTDMTVNDDGNPSNDSHGPPITDGSSCFGIPKDLFLLWFQPNSIMSKPVTTFWRIAGLSYLQVRLNKGQRGITNRARWILRRPSACPSVCRHFHWFQRQALDRRTTLSQFLSKETMLNRFFVCKVLIISTQRRQRQQGYDGLSLCVCQSAASQVPIRSKRLFSKSLYLCNIVSDIVLCFHFYSTSTRPLARSVGLSRNPLSLV